jgi:acyl-CoA thioesterase FadM
VTAEFTVRYKKPVPLNVLLKVTAQMTENNRRLFRVTGELILPDGVVAATAKGVYVKQKLDRIVEAHGPGADRPRVKQEIDLEYVEC